jgi:hypothetical protein
MSTEWEADRWLERHINWDRRVSDIRSGLDKLGADDDRAEFEAALAAGQEAAADRGSANLMQVMLDAASEPMVAAFVDLGCSPHLFTAVRVKPTFWNSVSATFREFDDGSAGLAVATTLASLIDSYARFAAVPMADISGGSPFRGLWKSGRAAQRGSLLDNPRPLSGFLRYTFVNLRIYGLSAKLVLRTSAQAVEITTLITAYAIRFVIGHELAHRALGHQGVQHGVATGAQSDLLAQEQESAADELAFRALTRSIEAEFATMGALRSQAPAMAVLGALTAFLAVYADEQAVFVRQGNSHPPVTARIEQLMRQVGSQEHEFARLFGSALVTATDTAALFGPGALTFSWEALHAADPRITTPQPASYLKQIGMWDQLMCLSDAKLIGFLTDDAAHPAVSAGVELMLANEPEAALLRWGAPERDARILSDWNGPLVYHNLVATLRKGFATVGLPEAHRFGTAVAAASLAARHMAHPNA